MVLHYHEEIPELSGYNILADDKLPNYDIIITDQFLNITRRMLHKNRKIIYIGHGSDASPSDTHFNNFSLSIGSFEKQPSANLLYLNDYNSKLYPIENYDENIKCEFAYTGPHNMEGLLKWKNENKKVMRAKLEEAIGVKLPEDKPLICVVKDGYVDLSHIAYAMNKLVKYATVIFKPICKTPENLDKNIIVFNYSHEIFDLIRFSSDFIFAGITSSTLVSCISIGLCVIPYYSRIMLPEAPFLPMFWKKFIPAYIGSINNSARSILLYKFYKEHKLFDLLDINKLRDAILGTEYTTWYQQNLKNLQKDALGDYTLENPAKKTADYIMRFVTEGTLGKDCHAIYFKEPH